VSGGLRVLDRAAVRRILSWDRLVPAVESGLALAASGESSRAVASQLAIPGSSLHLKSGAIDESPLISVKANLRPDAGSSSGALLIFDGARQALGVIAASADFTAMRTAASAAVAATTLGAGQAGEVAILGAGPVATFTLEVLRHLGMGSTARVWSRNRQRAEAFAARAGGSTTVATTVAEATRHAEIIVTATPARSPFLAASDLPEQGVVLAMGADSPGKRELGAGVLDHADVYADVREDAVRVGESVYAAPQVQSRVTELGAVVGRPRRQHDVAVFDSVGSSIVDAAVARILLDHAAEGYELDLER
jgi:ornithine cyclodeaminase/alanine dehydrogenase-like protein (mu-crystallin family)